MQTEKLKPREREGFAQSHPASYEPGLQSSSLTSERKKESGSQVSQSCPTLCHPMDCSPPGSSIHGIFQARILEWAAIPFSIPDFWSRLISTHFTSQAGVWGGSVGLPNILKVEGVRIIRCFVSSCVGRVSHHLHTTTRWRVAQHRQGGQYMVVN